MMTEISKQLSEEEMGSVVGGKTDEFGEYIVEPDQPHKRDPKVKPGAYYQEGNWMYYKIQEGDNLAGISKKFGVSIPRLQTINPNTIQKTRLIYKDDIIRIRLANG